MQYVHQLLLFCMQVTPSHVPKQLFFTVADIHQLMCDKLSTAAYQETRGNPPSECITKNNMWPWRMAWQFYTEHNDHRIYNSTAYPARLQVLLVDDFTYVHAYIKLHPYADFTCNPCNKGLL